jgi:hypothetical protein
VWENITSFLTSGEKFFDVYAPEFDTSELNVMNVFENVFDVALVQLIVDEINRFAQQEISKSTMCVPFTFCCRARDFEDVTVVEIYMVLALFMMRDIIQKLTLRSYY